jgi:hypothetical protein
MALRLDSTVTILSHRAPKRLGNDEVAADASRAPASSNVLANRCSDP